MLILYLNFDIQREIFLVNFAIKTKLDEISYFKKKTLEAEEQVVI